MTVEELQGVRERPSGGSEGSPDQIRLRARLRQLEADQNLLMGVIAGSAAATAGAITWALITVATEYQIGWMAVGVGALVGYAVRMLGKGVTPVFGVIGAVLSLVGCLAGNLLSTCMYVAKQESIPLTQILAQLNPEVTVALVAETFSPIDLVFYGLAVYFAYQYSFRRTTPEDLALPHEQRTQ